MALVHPVLTEDQAELVHQALIAFLNSSAGQISENPGEEAAIKQSLSELVFFFDGITTHPEKFGLRSIEDTKRIARAAKPLKGPAQPKGQRNKRKLRQAAHVGSSKRRREAAKLAAAQHNERRAEAEARQNAIQAVENQKRQEFIDRFEAIARKEVLSNEDLQTVLTLFGLPEAATRASELSAGEGFADRILGAGSSEGLPAPDPVLLP